MRRYVSILLMAWMLLSACHDNLVFSTFKATPTNGWDKNEPVRFEVSQLTDEGEHQMLLGLRLSDDYPFRNFHVVVKQEHYPSGTETTDTVIYNVVDRHGNINGQGVNYYQYEAPVRLLDISKGDSLSITVKHIMKREIMPGVLDVGVILEKTNKK